jgi:branched-chain amino acid transport system permease protein
MILFVTSVVGGLWLGGTYALIALGIVLAFRSTGTFSFAHGELVTFGAFIVAGWSVARGSPFAIVAALLVPAGIAAAFFLVVLRRMTGAASHFTGVIATLGLASILDGVLALVFTQGDYQYSFPGVPTGVTRVFGVRVASADLVLGAAAIIVTVSVSLFFRYTHFGKVVFAAGQDPLLASQSGINVRAVYLITWAVSGFLAGVAGVAYISANPSDLSLTGIAFAAFPAILIGGIDSLFGAIVGGLTIGLLQSFTTTYYGPQYISIVTYSLLLLVLLVKPTGLFGTRQIRRV